MVQGANPPLLLYSGENRPATKANPRLGSAPKASWQGMAKSADPMRNNSVSFENYKNLSDRFVLLVERSRLVRQIRIWIKFEVSKFLVQK